DVKKVTLRLNKLKMLLRLLKQQPQLRIQPKVLMLLNKLRHKQLFNRSNKPTQDRTFNNNKLNKHQQQDKLLRDGQENQILRTDNQDTDVMFRLEQFFLNLNSEKTTKKLFQTL